MKDFLIWFMIAAVGFGLCILLPIRIQNDVWRKRAMRWILVPVSLILMFYVYPFGLELFRRLAID